MTAKRDRPCDPRDEQGRPAKRTRTRKHELMSFTDEIILRILSYLEVTDLIAVQGVSQRLQQLSKDSSIWREKYYERWVHHRVRRLRGTKSRDINSTLRHSSKLSRWLNHQRIPQEDDRLDWKRQYRIKTNWWRGKCRIQEVDVASPPTPPILAKIHKGYIITAEREHGLRVWSKTLRKDALSTREFPASPNSPSPTALAVDSTGTPEIMIALCFSDGSFEVLGYTSKDGIRLIYLHQRVKQLCISACAISFPYVLTVSDGKIVSLHQVSASDSPSSSNAFRCKLLTSLRSESAYSPVSLSIRRNSGGIVVACIAYAFFRLNVGWSLGLQELRLNSRGDLLDCRLTSTEDSGDSNTGEASSAPGVRASTRSAFSKTFALHPHLMNHPSSISYSHPYLTASLPDNTLVVYLVNSDAMSLVINSGRRLWGHTSSISGVEVDQRGRAVSISTKGGETRVWEFEDILSSNSINRSSIKIEPVQDLSFITSAVARRGNGLGLAVRSVQDELTITRKWVGFDEEQIIALGEEPDKRQILSCYDFT